jgi:uncharacterized protein (UPF0303 family)
MSELERDREARIAIVQQQEQRAQFDNFDEETAYDLGATLYAIARKARAPVAVNIRTADRALFHASLPGATPDNDSWIRRKSNIVLRYHQSSLQFGDRLALKGRTLEPDMGITFADYAAHGGSFPIRIAKAGVIAAITVSGLPQLDDHRMVIAALAAFLKMELPGF